jgi:hypothetical protein
MEDGGWRIEEGGWRMGDGRWGMDEGGRGGRIQGRKGAARRMGGPHEGSAQLRFGSPNPGKESGNVLSEGDVKCDPRGISDRPVSPPTSGAILDHRLLTVAPSVRQAPRTCILPDRMADDVPRV